ncbi:DNA internalization-related competence protein ComEC/Rec2 [Bacillus songklensis]|uniref:DNA internalization-related competence protein ComEC/Rec2 n=1 Tax=Bacillus songklensis TaxID=1069116 RepID=A0ABV8B182_9BACI
MIRRVKGFWIYIAFAAVLAFICLTWQEPVVWLAFGTYLFWLYHYVPRPVFYASIIASIFLPGHYIVTEKSNHTMLSSSQTSFQGYISTIPDLNGRTLSFHFRLPDETIIVMYNISTAEEKKELQKLRVGASCQLKGTLTEPEKRRNEAGFNYAQYLHQQRIHWVLSLSDMSLGRCASSAGKEYMFSSWRESGLRFIEKNVKQPSLGMMQALIYGERKNISEETLGYYQEGGVIHLLAISGLHVGFLSGILFYFLVRIGVTRENATLSLMIVLPVYGAVAGASPSVIRAVMMTVLILLVIRIKTTITSHDAISLTFLIMVGVQPYYIYQIGFQLSFMVSFFLIMSRGIIMKGYSSFLKQLIAASIVSQLGSLPLILYHFHQVSLLSLPLNLLFIPLFSIFVLPICLLMFLTWIICSPLGEIMAFLLNAVLEVSGEMVKFAVTAPFTQLIFGKPPFYLMAGLYAVIVCLFAMVEKQVKTWMWPAAGLLLLLLFQYFQFNMNPQGRVTFIDVGQGDSILIELPYRRGVYLIDTGGSMPFAREPWQVKRKPFEVGKHVLVPFLRARGIRHIDKLIITHGDYDHAGAAQTVLKKVHVKELVLGKKDVLDELEEKAIKQSISKGAKVTFMEKGDGWKEGGYSFFFLSPAGNETTKNDQSLVLFSRMGGLNWLFTGDMESNGEEKLVLNFPLLKADIVKVGHHGSKTSTSSLFLDHIKPKVAIISVGKNNRYQHPHSSVIKELQKRDIAILRTDEHGAISYIFLKNDGTFRWEIP